MNKESKDRQSNLASHGTKARISPVVSQLFRAIGSEMTEMVCIKVPGEKDGRMESRLVSKAEAMVIARYLRAEGGTNLYGALMAAMSDDEVDALVLLSDGDPTVGDIVDKDRIVEEVLKRNRLLQAKIHVIALGRADRSFLKRLALGTNGTFKSF